MKAIVILFEGDYVSNARKDVTIRDIAHAMTQHIKIESDNLKIVDFEDLSFRSLHPKFSQLLRLTPAELHPVP